MWRRVGRLVQVQSTRTIPPRSVPVRYRARPTIAVRRRRDKGKISKQHTIEIINPISSVSRYRYPPRFYSMSELVSDPSSSTSPQFTLTEQEQKIFDKVIQAVRRIKMH